MDRRAGPYPAVKDQPPSFFHEPTAYLVIREEVYREMQRLAIIDHSDRSLYEFGEFYPDR